MLRVSPQVRAYLNTVDEQYRADAETLLQLFMDATKTKPLMWGSMVGFGSYHYMYDSGREGDAFATGFAIRKTGPTIYIMPGYQDYSAILKDLGPHKLGKSCLYLKNLNDIHLPTLKKLIKQGVRDLRKIYPVTME